MNCRLISTPMGWLKLEAKTMDGQAALTALDFVDSLTDEKSDRFSCAAGEACDACDSLLGEAERQLGEYFAGERQTFQLPLAPAGTPFQMRVWQALQTIPYGQTVSYGALARSVGCPGGSRAVGQAVGANPLPILIPCHRVICGDGSLGGFSCGVERKRILLDIEGVH